MNTEVTNKKLWLAQNTVLVKLSRLIKDCTLSEQEKCMYDLAMQNCSSKIEKMKGLFASDGMRNQDNSHSEGYNAAWIEDWAEGWIIGWIEGYYEAITNSARKMMALGFSLNIISQATGLSEGEIAKL